MTWRLLLGPGTQEAGYGAGGPPGARDESSSGGIGAGWADRMRSGVQYSSPGAGGG
ncbi:MAG TPA: hypothetical protein VFU43_30365 [Streptosporangiaceae bacterium]|nr:hypothetical protein [Streptosporangiaceae bacterium]